ncbi:MAG TPA: glutathione binding-like protein, partial [Caulobacteraceae bacterium]|nr:glutathione binding-like protein [Caulobacteraceae bacterium]
GGSGEEKTKAGQAIRKRMDYLAERMSGDFVLGSQLSAADCYLFVMLLWAQRTGLDVPNTLAAFRDRMMQRPAVQKAMKHEGLI